MLSLLISPRVGSVNIRGGTALILWVYSFWVHLEGIL